MKISAQTRQLTGTGASRRLRNAGMTPGIVYGAKNEPVSIQVDHNTLYYALKREEFHSSILDLELDGKVEKVLLRDYQPHAYKPLILHVDFQRVDPNEKITMRIPLHFLNEDTCPGAKGGIIHREAVELEIVCLPADLPSHIDVDVASLNVGDTIHIGDIALPNGVKATQDKGLPVISSSAASGSAEPEAAAAEAAAEEGEKKE